MKYSRIILAVIIGLAIAARFTGLGSVPPSPDWDEAALGYNAWSIIQTGKDEYGTSFPVIFRSFDDYKPGLYVYLAIPSILLFGLTTFAVRLPSAIIGVFAVWATYELVRGLLSGLRDKTDRTDKTNKEADVVALFSAFFMAISPWHIQFSRIAFEASVGMAFTIFGTLCFLKGLRKPWYWYFTAFWYALAIYVYQSEKVFIPLLMVSLVIVFWRTLFSSWKHLIGPGILFGLIAVPFYWQTISDPDALLRAKGVSLFADQTPYLSKTVKRLERDYASGDMLGIIFDNRRVTYAVGFAQSYLSHFDINWLFVTGDQARHQPPEFGHLYLFELPLIVIGLYVLLFGRYDRRVKLLLLLWIMMTPMPASITTGTPHPIRTIHFLPGVHILSAIGVVYCIDWMKKNGRHAFLYGSVASVAGIVVFCNIAYYIAQYAIQYSYASSQEWQYGYEEAVPFVASIAQGYDRVIVSNQDPLGQSYIFFLYYLKYDPSSYIAEGGSETGGFAEQHSFGPYEFRPFDWANEQQLGRTLYVGRPGDFPHDVPSLKTVYYLDGTPAIKIVEK